MREGFKQNFPKVCSLDNLLCKINIELTFENVYLSMSARLWAWLSALFLRVSIAVCCGVLQCVAVCCSVVQCGARGFQL